MPNLFATDEVDAFSFERLYGNEKYSLQKMELKSTNFPAQIEPNMATAVWSDRIYTQWRDAMNGITSTMSADAFWAGVSNEDLLLFASRVATAIDFRHKVTGARITRYTNAASGYPCLVLEITSGGKGIRAPKQPKRDLRFDRFGFFGYDESERW